MIIVLYVSKGRKLPLPSRNFDIGACDIIMTSSEPQKLVFLLWAQSKVMETIVNNSFSWGTTKTSFSVKIDNSMTSCNSEWGLVTSPDLENILLWFKVITKTWKHTTELTKTFFLRKTVAIVTSSKNERKHGKYPKLS